MTGQIDIVQPANGGMIFIMRPEREGASPGADAKQQKAFVLRYVGHLSFLFQLSVFCEVECAHLRCLWLRHFQSGFEILLFSFSFFSFFSLQDKFSGTYCFLKMSLFTANVIYHNNPTETKSPVSSNASKET